MDDRIKILSNSIGNIYLGDWLIDKYNDEELKKRIHYLADQELYNTVINNKSVERIDNVVIISLILIALEEYDGSFWQHIIDYYPTTFSNDDSDLNKSEQWINNKIREKITYVYGETKSGSRIINHLLVEAFVPKKYLSGLFEFAHAILKYNYDFYLFEYNDFEAREEVKEELLEIFNFLFSDTEIDEDYNSFKYTLDNSYKEYELITSTKIALGNKDIAEALIPLIIDILKILEAQYYSQDISHKFKNKYLLYGLSEWNNKSNNIIEKNKDSRPSGDRTFIRPKVVKYNVKNKSVILKSRRHNIVNYKSGDSIRIEVMNNDKLVYINNSPSIKKVMGAYRIDPIEIEINYFLGKLEYRLLVNEQCYYTSKSLLNFNYLFFDNQGNLLTDYSSYEGNMIITTDTQLASGDYRYETINNGFVYFLEKTLDTVLDFGSIKVVSEEKLNNSMNGTKENLRATIDEIDIDVYKKIKTLIIENNNLNKNIIHLRINDINYKIPIQSIQSINNDDKYFYEINLDFLDLESNIYLVEVLEGSKGKITEFKFILDKEIKVSEKIRNGLVLTQKLNSSFFKEINIEQDLLDLKEIPISIVSNSFIVKDSEVTYTKEIVNDHYKFNGEHYHQNKYIWLPDVENRIEFYFDNIKNIKVYTNENEYIKKYNPEDNGEIFSIHKNDLNILIDEYNTVGLQLIIYTQKERLLIEVLNNNYLVEQKNNVFYTENKYFLDLQFKGKNKLFIETYENNIRVLRTTEEKSNFVELPLKKDKKMNIQIIEGENNPFLNTSRKVLKSIDFYHHSLESLLSKNYIVESAYSYETDTEYSVRNTYLRDLRIENNELVGTLYFVVHGYKVYEFRELNPIIINFTQDVFDSSRIFTIETEVVDKDHDGLILGEKRREISYDGEEFNNREKSILVDSIKLRVSEVTF